MSNRIPLIKILTAEDLGDGTSFKDFQIFITTYDREWFNVAKSYLNEGWQKSEFYVDNHSGPVERPLIRKSGTYEERAKFHFIHGDYPACANYLRKAFEQTLRKILPDNVLYTGFGRSDVEASPIILSKQLLSIKETDHNWFFSPKAATGVSSSSARPAGLHNLIDMFRALMNNYNIPFPLLEELTRIKNRLLNPLSHDDLSSPIFKNELEIGFAILKELLDVKSKIIIDISNDTPAYLFFDKEDAAGIDYKYKFQLLENLRYLEYNGEGRILNAECKPVNRTRKSINEEEPGEGKSRKSIYELCKGICIYSAKKEDKASIVLDEMSLANLVYNENGQTLNDLI